jgi:hypothetical protein
MKYKSTIYSSIILCILPSVLFLDLELRLFTIVCFILAIVLNNNKKSDLFFISTVTPLFLIIAFDITGYEVGYLFEDDRYYWKNGMDLHLNNYKHLISNYFFERTIRFDNYIYWVAIIIKGIGKSMSSIYLFNYLCFLLICSKMIPKHKNIASWTEIPFELIFFIFFIFKDLFATSLLFYTITSFKNLKLGSKVILLLMLILCLEPLRIGYSLIPIVAFLIPNKIFLLRYRLIILSISFGIIFSLLFGSEILNLLHPKIDFYKQSLLFRVDNSSGFLSILFNGVLKSNYLLIPIFIALATFIPLLSLQEGLVTFGLIRGISLFVFFTYLIGTIKNAKSFYIEKCTFALILLQVLLAPGMLRHSLIILPYIYMIYYEKNINIYRRASILSPRNM